MVRCRPDGNLIVDVCEFGFVMTDITESSEDVSDDDEFSSFEAKFCIDS